MSEIIEKNKIFLVKSKFGTYTFNNRKTAEQLNNQLNKYENTIKSHENLIEKYKKANQQLIQTLMTIKILEHELEQLREALK